MHENHLIDVPPAKDIHVLAQRCLRAEMDRYLSKNSMKELQRYLNEFTLYCNNHGIHSANELTPSFLLPDDHMVKCTGCVQPRLSRHPPCPPFPGSLL